jgi:predicted enzyme related to lactoylglutathione lyase
MDVSSVVFNLNSPQPDKLRAFYAGLIGLKPNPQMGEGALIAATTPFLVDSHDALSGPTREPARTMTNFMVDDVVKEQARLEAAGVRLLGPPSDDVISFATFVDADGSYGQIFSMPGTPPGAEGFALMRHSADPERLKDFMRNVVGLSDDHPELGNPFIAGGTSIYIGAHSDVTGPSKEPARALINFFVGDLAAEQKRIEEHGVKFIRSAGREPWGGIISTFADPDGNYLQLIEFRL